MEIPTPVEPKVFSPAKVNTNVSSYCIHNKLAKHSQTLFSKNLGSFNLMLLGTCFTINYKNYFVCHLQTLQHRKNKLLKLLVY